MSFSKTSLDRLHTCNPNLIKVFEKAITTCPIDFGIACGYRSPAEQMEAYKAKKSKCDGIKNKSKHNSNPSNAVDVYAFVNGKANYDKQNMALIAGCVLSIAKEMGVNLVWGGSWTGFIDMPHYEIA